MHFTQIVKYIHWRFIKLNMDGSVICDTLDTMIRIKVFVHGDLEE